MDKAKFLKEDYIPLLKKLKGDEKGNWGVLSAQGMVEHMSDSVAEGSERIKRNLQTPEHLVQRFREFALSEKEFKPETKNALMSETPAALRHKNISDAINELEKEIATFFDYHDKNPGKIITNPFFGDFNYEEWLHLLHKHAIHHLKQFSLL
jgi:hypothetical protein